MFSDFVFDTPIQAHNEETAKNSLLHARFVAL